MKTYKLSIKADDKIIIEENNTLVEISADIDASKASFQRFHNKIDYHARLIMSLSDPLARWVGWKQYISENAYNAAKRALSDNMRMVRIDIENAKNHPIWHEMAKIVKDYVKHFQSDFTYHDTLTISRSPGISFIWIVRETGTWLLSDKTGKEILDYCIKHNKEARYYHANNNNLRQITPENASLILAKM